MHTHGHAWCEYDCGMTYHIGFSAHKTSRNKGGCQSEASCGMWIARHLRRTGDEMEQTRIPKNRSLMIRNAMKKVGMTTNILRLQHHES